MNKEEKYPIITNDIKDKSTYILAILCFLLTMFWIYLAYDVSRPFLFLLSIFLCAINTLISGIFFFVNKVRKNNRRAEKYLLSLLVTYLILILTFIGNEITNI